MKHCSYKHRKLKPARDKIEPIELTNPKRDIFKDIPKEVLHVWSDNMVASFHGFTTLEAIKRKEAAVLKYPQYFNWETKYNLIPQEVHDAYSADLESFLWNKNETGLAFHDGLVAEISKATVHVYDSSKFNLQSMVHWIAESWERDRQKKEKERIERERNIELWNKHYATYNLEWRD